MRSAYVLASLLSIAGLGYGQTDQGATPKVETPTPLAPGQTKDAMAVFAAARPFYNFHADDMKPWHLKVSYQLYDAQGNPSDQGTYEHWWASPQTHRSTWIRGGVTHTDWYTEDGQHQRKHFYEASDGRLSFVEHMLQSALLSPLPAEKDLDLEKVRLDREPFPDKARDVPCFMLVPRSNVFGSTQNLFLGLFPTYCFDSKLPVLLGSYSMGSVAEQFGKIVKVQGRYLPREVVFFEDNRKVLSASVDSITALTATDAALIPDPAAHTVGGDSQPVSEDRIKPALIKKTVPVYPQDAKDARVTGTVKLRAIIGTDGGVHEVRVLSAPWPSMAASALRCVSHWEYQPALSNGEPVEVSVTINMTFSLGGRP